LKRMSDKTPTEADIEDPNVSIHWLSPENTSIYESDFSLLHCRIKGDETVYRGVFAALMFPIRAPRRFVSLRYFNKKGHEEEIGVIQNLLEFAKQEQQLIRRRLNRHYHQQVISRVYQIQSEYGMLFFDVETQRGREQFVMPWRSDRAEDYGEKGKVLRESLGNRYIIPDIEELPPADQRRFTSYIYW